MNLFEAISDFKAAALLQEKRQQARAEIEAALADARGPGLSDYEVDRARGVGRGLSTLLPDRPAMRNDMETLGFPWVDKPGKTAHKRMRARARMALGRRQPKMPGAAP